MKPEDKLNIQATRLFGEFIGTLEGVCLWEIPEELKLKLQTQLTELRKAKIISFNLPVMARCITCAHFTKTYEPKLCWVDRMAEVKTQHPNMSEQACVALAKDWKLWGQKETEKGFCKYHDIEQQIPNHFSCLNHNVA